MKSSAQRRAGIQKLPRLKARGSDGEDHLDLRVAFVVPEVIDACGNLDAVAFVQAEFLLIELIRYACPFAPMPSESRPASA